MLRIIILDLDFSTVDRILYLIIKAVKETMIERAMKAAGGEAASNRTQLKGIGDEYCPAGGGSPLLGLSLP